MESTDAEVLYLIEYTPWWTLFYSKCKRPPTLQEMRAKLIKDENEKKAMEAEELLIHRKSRK